jgi:NADH-quinone oxidoreductase subunit M
MTELPVLTLLTLLPLFGGLGLLLFPSTHPETVRRAALGISLVPLLLMALLWGAFDSASGQFQFIERHTWIPTLGVEYFLAIDGLSLVMLLLTGLLVPMAVLASWELADRPRLYFALILFVQSGLIGVFTALNFFHWFLFWELSLIPAFFLVKNWGGTGRASAALQFFVYTMVGSIALLLGFLALHQVTGTFSFPELAAMAKSGELSNALAARWGDASSGWPLVIFACVFLGFAVKVPIMPFHTWQPATYAIAPTTTTMLLTGLMSKMGAYGFLRILLPIFPEQLRVILTPLLWLVVLTIIFSAFAAFAQRDLKRMLAYSSINHLGYCVLGILAVATLTEETVFWETEKAAALNGVILQMFNHGVIAAALFAFVAFLESRSGGLRGLNDFGGLRKVVPVFCGLMGISVFASIGLPGLSGFVGEFLIFKGVFSLATWTAALATIGLLVTAVFLLTLMQRVFFGPVNEKWSKFPDLNLRERIAIVPATALIFALGIYPQALLEFINPTVLTIVRNLAP